MIYRIKHMSRFSKKEIDSLFRSSKRVVTHPLLHILRGLKKQEFGRVLIITSKKVGSAPQRNKFRRRVKAIFYEDRLFEHLQDIIVIAKPGAPELPFNELKTLLNKTFTAS